MAIVLSWPPLPYPYPYPLPPIRHGSGLEAAAEISKTVKERVPCIFGKEQKGKRRVGFFGCPNNNIRCYPQDDNAPARQV